VETNRAVFHLKRPRLNLLFREAVKYPLTVVCAGAGYGKTSAVHDFAEEYRAATVWTQLSERDNVGARFWENYSHSIAQSNTPFADAINKLGFPDNADKMNQYFAILRKFVELKERIIVMDDFHFIREPAVINFIEHAIPNLPVGTSLIIISRSTPPVNNTLLISKGLLFNISENDLRFTENELTQYFSGQNIDLQPEGLHEIMQDTEGWAFAINLIAHSYRKAPGYVGYLRSAMKSNIFALMKTEIWDGISLRLQHFLVRLSLISHLSTDLIALLAGDDKDLIIEMEKQSAYVRKDSFINAYLIHPLFLEFLAAKQELLSDEQKRETYATAGAWCSENGFKIDAVSYYEKIGDYKSIVTELYTFPMQIPLDISRLGKAIFSRAPSQAFDTVNYLAIMNLRVTMCQGFWQESTELMEYYEAKYLQLPENDPFRKRALGGIYFCWGYLRRLMCVTDDSYDFDLYFEKFAKHFPKPADMFRFANHCPPPWLNCAGTSRKGAPEEFIGALTRMVSHLSPCLNGYMSGEDSAAWGELRFYQGDTRAAQSCFSRALELAIENKQFETTHRSLLYILRIAVSQGNYTKMEQAMKDLKAGLDENDYSNRFINYDLSLALFHCLLGLPEKIPEWLKQDFAPYVHAAFTDNFGNQMKARFCYMTRNYAPLLSYIKEMRQRESYLLGRVEILAMEACVHYKMKDKKRAFDVLLEAYNTASPNNLLMPFIELGKDMRTLASSALKESAGGIPKDWLENISRKSTTYAKRQAHVITEYRQANLLAEKIDFTPREMEILTDLSQGLSRADIAASRKLSVNTVKMIIARIYMKLGAKNFADLIRIAVERKII
jgi:LuxR family maltose regulon positive regulatory protein